VTKVVYVDMDGVLCNCTMGDYTKAEPNVGNIRKVNKLFDDGYMVVVWSARKHDDDPLGVFNLTKAQLDKWGVRYHVLSFDKPMYDILVDDKARDVFGFKPGMTIANKDITVDKVWGSEVWLVNNDMYCGKILSLNKDAHCSLHYHKIKEETFFILEGKVLMEVGKDTRTMVCGDSVHIKPRTNHRFTGLVDSKILEISTQHFEDDSYRLEVSGKI